VVADSTGDARFPVTHASALEGVRSADPRERDRSWEALIAAYWKPAYKHVRVRWRAAPEDAEDAIQSFFERAVEKDIFAPYEPERGRFRSFFRVCLDRHVANLVKAENRQKRGGGVRALSLDFEGAEDELARAGAAAWEAPEDCFDREWRRNVLALAIGALRRECAETGKAPVFVAFERYDLCDAAERPTYDTLGRELGIPPSTVTNHLALARRELRRIAIAKLREITGSDGELRAEVGLLFGGGAR
jgi:RNA polymerase sigma factor (sigma-70 family)